MEKKTILVIFGGFSTEYYVSCKSAAGILEFIDRTRYDVVKVGVTIDGQWILTDAEPNEIEDGKTWLDKKENRNAVISPNRYKNELLVFDDTLIRKVHIDCVFPIIHGHGGEDGNIQGLLEISNIPYVGSGVAASANAMDKQLTRIFAERCDLLQPECITLKRSEYDEDKEKYKNSIDFDYPIYVKPASLGSSVGITKVVKEAELEQAVETAFSYEDKILIEEGIEGSEIKVAVMGNQELSVGAICELIMPDNAINDYATKYIKSSSIKKIPAGLDPAIESEAVRQACAIYRELDCRGFARVDFFLGENGKLYFNEINTVPGFSAKSVYTLMFEAKGVSYAEIINKLIRLAIENKKQVKDINNKTFNSIF